MISHWSHHLGDAVFTADPRIGLHLFYGTHAPAWVPTQDAPASRNPAKTNQVPATGRRSVQTCIPKPELGNDKNLLE